MFENGAFEGKKGSWNIHYNFDQYFYEPKKGCGEGIGVFGRFGASDGNPNFMHFFYSLGSVVKVLFLLAQTIATAWDFYYIDVNNPDLRASVSEH